MEVFFSSFTHVTWWIIGIILMVFEIFTSGFFLLWLGVAAFTVGSLMYFKVPLSWEMQLVLFSIISIVSIVLWRRWQKSRKNVIDDPNNPHLSRRAEQYIGKEFVLAVAVKNGVGKVKVGDTLWLAKSSSDIDAGSKVKILSVDGAAFNVESTYG